MIDCCRLRAPLFALYFTFLQQPKHLSQNQHASDDRVIKREPRKCSAKLNENQVQGDTRGGVFSGGGGGKGLGVLWSLRTGMQLASGRGIPRGGVGSIRQG